ncbi:MAG: bacillithiol biosynthesis BshC [Gemmatimonadaceae bacterium]
MSGVPTVITEPLGGSRLARDAAAGLLDEWYGRRPASPAAWRTHLEGVRAGMGSATWLDALRPALGESVAAGAAGARLARAAASGVVVTTGQQPGLFGGPVYTWSKALAARALADELERATGVPVAPVFWAATDDADFAEASVTSVAVPGGAEELRIAPTAPEATPMSAVPLGDDVVAAFERLHGGAGSAAFGGLYWSVVRDAYAPGVTVGGAYVRLLRALLEPLGVAVLDASHPATRAAADATLRAALRRASAVDQALARRSAEIEARGYAVQVPPVAGLALAFVDDAGAKRRARLDEAAALAEAAAPGSLGPNVLLRPVVERAILPSAAYVAGPGELSYFAQVGAVAQALGAAAPLAVPRWSCTILEPHVARLLARHGLEIAELEAPHAAESRLARRALPAPVGDALRALRESLRDGVVDLRAARDSARDAARTREGADDPLLPDAVLEGAARALEHRVGRLERRALAGVKRQERELMRDVATARGALFPGGKRQERALNLLPMLARHGPSLVDAMAARAAEHAASLVAGGPAAARTREAELGVAAG